MPKLPKNEKIIGYALLILGVILLLFSIVEMITVYYGYAPPPKLFNLKDISLPGDNGSNISLIQGTQASQLPNLFFWFLLMGFVNPGSSFGTHPVRFIDNQHAFFNAITSQNQSDTDHQ